MAEFGCDTASKVMSSSPTGQSPSRHSVEEVNLPISTLGNPKQTYLNLGPEPATSVFIIVAYSSYYFLYDDNDGYH